MASLSNVCASIHFNCQSIAIAIESELHPVNRYPSLHFQNKEKQKIATIKRSDDKIKKQ